MNLNAVVFLLTAPFAVTWAMLNMVTWGRYGDPPTRLQYVRRELAPVATVTGVAVAFLVWAPGLAHRFGLGPAWWRVYLTLAYLGISWAAWHDRDDRWQRRRARVAAWLTRRGRALAPGGAS